MKQLLPHDFVWLCFLVPDGQHPRNKQELWTFPRNMVFMIVSQPLEQLVRSYTLREFHRIKHDSQTCSPLFSRDFLLESKVCQPLQEKGLPK